MNTSLSGMQGFPPENKSRKLNGHQQETDRHGAEQQPFRHVDGAHVRIAEPVGLGCRLTRVPDQEQADDDAQSRYDPREGRGGTAWQGRSEHFDENVPL